VFGGNMEIINLQTEGVEIKIEMPANDVEKME
jgi:hypothetical protein